MPSYMTVILQAAALAGLSNVVAQAVKAQRANVPLVIDWVPIYQFMVFSLINTPVNIFWQQYLEYAFPSTRVEAVTAKTVKEGQVITPKKKTNTGNIFKKFALDQTIGASWNTLSFIIGMGAIQGLNLAKILTKVEREAMPLLMAGLKIWPAVSFLNFAVFPVGFRVVVGNLAGFAWGVYLSLNA